MRGKILVGILLLNISVAFAQPAVIPSGQSLKVMTYNILNGYDYGKDSVREQTTATFIAAQHPDVVALQELCGFTETKLKDFAMQWGHQYVAILKEDGYPVGLTSNQPITTKKKMTDGLWHGMLHVATHGVDFFVVHLSPADHNIRLREAHTIITYMREMLKDENKNFMVLGDFNAHSPFDAFLNKERPMLLAKYERGDANGEHKNLMDNTYDYSVISAFLAYPLIDVCERMMEAEDKFSFPTPILIGTWRKPGEIVPTRERIDYILTSRTLAQLCTNASIINTGIVDKLSDHFPVIAEFDMPQ